MNVYTIAVYPVRIERGEMMSKIREEYRIAVYPVRIESRIRPDP